MGERRPLRPRRLGLDERRREGHARSQGDPVRDSLDQRPLHARLGDAARRVQGVRLRQGPEHVRDRGLHGRQARDAQDLNASVGPSRTEVARVLEGLDRTELAAARWYGAKGVAIEGVELQAAFVLDPDSPHILAVARLVGAGGAALRYTFALTGRPLHL